MLGAGSAEMKNPRTTAAMLLLLAACGPAAAQAQGSGAAGPSDSARQRGPEMSMTAPLPGAAGGTALLPDTAEPGALIVLSPALVGKNPAQKLDRFSRFTRLAGMFMGKVPALAVGNMRICFKLDLR
jgi:hypothetical protein